MSRSAGYILRLTKDRQMVFDNRQDGNRFAEAVPEFQHSRTTMLLCFIVDPDDRITHLADGSRGMRAGDEQRRLNLTDIKSLTPITLTDLADHLPARLASVFRRKIRSGGLLSPKVFDEMVEKLRALRPETSAILQQFSLERRKRLHRLPKKASENLALQKEAVGTALAIAGISRDDLMGWDYDEVDATSAAEQQAAFPSFIAGLPKVRLREDQMLANDLSAFPGYTAVRTASFAATAFSNGVHNLTVILANRLPLEELTGADLVYYNSAFRCFLMCNTRPWSLKTSRTQQMK